MQMRWKQAEHNQYCGKYDGTRTQRVKGDRNNRMTMHAT